MTPAIRLSFSLVLSLLLWLPTVPSALASSEDPAMIALRYLVALLIARIGVGLVFRVVSGYAVDLLAEAVPEEPVAEAAAAQAAPVASADDLARRREDRRDSEASGGRGAGSEPEALLDEALEDVRDTAAMVP